MIIDNLIEAHDILVEARHTIRDERKWTQGEMYGWTLRGRRYCAVGAMRKTAGGGYTVSYGGRTLAVGYSDERARAFMFAWSRLSNATPFKSIVGYNDDYRTTHADVLRVFDIAISGLRDDIHAAEPSLIRFQPPLVRVATTDTDLAFSGD